MRNQFRRIMMIALTLAASMAVLGGGKAVAQECMIGEVKMFAGNFAPRNYAFANGQLLPISQNQALFSILGTTYGGDGRTTLALPDLRGRVSMGPGRGPGLSSYRLGQKGGAESVTQGAAQLASHSHAATTTATTTSTLTASATNGDSADPNGRVLANGRNNNKIYLADNSPTVSMNGASISSTTNASTAVGNAGGSQPMSIIQPYMAVNYIICLQGTYPSRN